MSQIIGVKTYSSRFTFGQIIIVTNALNETTAFTCYTANIAGKQCKGRLYQVTRPDGYHLRLAWDALNRPTHVTFPDDTFTKTSYQKLDTVTSRDRLGRLTQYVCNSIHQVTAFTGTTI